MNINIAFDCTTFMAAANNDGSISIRAEVESLTDSDGILLAIANKVGIEHARKILEIEWKHKEDYEVAKPSPLELEKFLLAPNKIIETKIPDVGLQHYKTGIRGGIPTALGYHASVGYFVLETSGQGPYLVWSEK